MRKLLALIPAAFFLVAAYNPTDAERARWTMHDMQSWRVCFAAYKSDHGTYPNVQTIDEAKALFEPVYIKRLPTLDAWGNAYDVKSEPAGFQVVSSGADGKFDRGSWNSGGKQTSYDADAVATQDGRWLFRFWDI